MLVVGSRIVVGLFRLSYYKENQRWRGLQGCCSRIVGFFNIKTYDYTIQLPHTHMHTHMYIL